MWITTSDLGRAVAVGVGATAVMDVAGEVLRRTRGVQPLDCRLLGRWIGHMPRGVLHHESIVGAPQVEREQVVGWAAHYAIGTGFAIAFVARDPRWMDRPTLAPALAMGVGTVAAPWFVMQPAFGMGVAASKAPNPMVARARSLRSHAIYGCGLWASAVVLRLLRKSVRGRG